MLKRFITRLDAEELSVLGEIGRSHGLKIAQVIRVAIAEYVATEKERTKAASEPLYGQGVGKALWMDGEVRARTSGRTTL